MGNYPAYVDRLLAQAREEGQWYCGQSDAAAICFEVLALFPDHREAADLVYELFCDEWLIYDNRTAIQQHIDEWDDRPWQQRRRLALSFRFMSQWEGWYREFEVGHEQEREGPPDVAEALQKGHDQLLHAYCLGDDETTDLVWAWFDAAIRRTTNPHAALIWVGKQYANHGFFVDAAEVLTELCGRFKDESANRLLAEVRWWRDYSHRIPWLPPWGDGSRYKRMMALIDPDAASQAEIIKKLRAKAIRSDSGSQGSALEPELEALMSEAQSRLIEPPHPDESPVDWSFLDEADNQPGELPSWARKMMRRSPPDLADEIAHRYRWSRPIQPPRTPPRRRPDELLYDLDMFFPFDDDFDDDLTDWMDDDL